MDFSIRKRPAISGVEVFNCLFELSAHCREHQMQVTHFKLTQEQFDALDSHLGDPRFRKSPMIDGYPIEVSP